MREFRQYLLKFLTDTTVWVAVTPVAFWIRVEQEWVDFSTEILALCLLGVFVKGSLVYALDWPHRSWRNIGMQDAVALVQGVALGALLFSALAFFLPSDLVIPRSVPLIEGMLALLVLGLLRFGARLRHERGGWFLNEERLSDRRVLIVGAGEGGTMIAREILRHPEAGLLPVGFLDDDSGKQRRRILGLRVLGSLNDLPRVVDQQQVDEVLIAIPSKGGEVVRRVVQLAQAAEAPHRIMPSVAELLHGGVSIDQLREVDLNDLLRRTPVPLDVAGIRDYLEGQTVLITGAGGSIGSEIARQVLAFAPKRTLLVGRGENSIYESEQACRRLFPDADFRAIIADVRDRAKLSYLFAEEQPTVVFHAAAHKHVPLMEANPDEAILNNVLGTRNVLELSLAHGVERLVNISTDKAVRPSSVMGASKRIAEYLVAWADRQAAPDNHYVSVRFGNVLGSRGSVVLRFREQIRRGGPVTVTHPDMQRYFMTIPEAVQLVLQAGSLHGEKGHVYVLDMGAPVRVIDLARDLILLSGRRPDVDIPIEITGVRPGEKLTEELLTAEEGTTATRHQKIFIANHIGLPDEQLIAGVNDLLVAAHTHDANEIRETLAALIPTHLLSREKTPQA